MDSTDQTATTKMKQEPDAVIDTGTSNEDGYLEWKYRFEQHINMKKLKLWRSIVQGPMIFCDKEMNSFHSYCFTCADTMLGLEIEIWFISGVPSLEVYILFPFETCRGINSSHFGNQTCI